MNRRASRQLSQSQKGRCDQQQVLDQNKKNSRLRKLDLGSDN